MAKVKMKTHKGLAKRVKKTGSGKLKRWSAFTGHLAANKSVKQRRQLRKSGLISSGDMKRIKHMLHN
ncbi:MAG: 50S ribosomal protein L35 [Culicoidibacterales bacterium]